MLTGETDKDPSLTLVINVTVLTSHIVIECDINSKQIKQRLALNVRASQLCVSSIMCSINAVKRIV